MHSIMLCSCLSFNPIAEHIFLRNVKSRKPPNIAPNWKTTYRLGKCALVALVPIGSRGEQLNQSARVIWAEIQTHKEDRDEWKER